MNSDYLVGVNVAALKALIKEIKSNPNIYSQQYWVLTTECGTSYCIAGLCYVRYSDSATKSDNDEVAMNAIHFASKFLGLSQRQANYLFSPARTLEQIEEFADGLWKDDGCSYASPVYDYIEPE